MGLFGNLFKGIRNYVVGQEPQPAFARVSGPNANYSTATFPERRRSLDTHLQPERAYPGRNGHSTNGNTEYIDDLSSFMKIDPEHRRGLVSRLSQKYPTRDDLENATRVQHGITLRNGSNTTYHINERVSEIIFPITQDEYATIDKSQRREIALSVVRDYDAKVAAISDQEKQSLRSMNKLERKEWYKQKRTSLIRDLAENKVVRYGSKSGFLSEELLTNMLNAYRFTPEELK